MDLRDRALLMTLYFEGLRRSEASRLRYRDITTKRGLVEVRNSKNNPYATIRLRPEVKRSIDDYLEVLNRELQKRETRPEDPVFCSLSRLRSFGKRLSPSAINESRSRCRRRAAMNGNPNFSRWSRLIRDIPPRRAASAGIGPATTAVPRAYSCVGAVGIISMLT